MGAMFVYDLYLYAQAQLLKGVEAVRVGGARQSSTRWRCR